ncbi:hypothetical protein LRS06_09155 [Hymenobacter sp. J193]|uniref:hypothetical protein n=1 Tax=Hymenobacter sp. J193 TaxID=2898429 RepID=UPI002150D3CE|nr:hypothetical protein [Hymenobacter sp. J193]MCR5887943.1 hypothetical protein [Hymenobacter sp. J193]
MPKAGLPDKLIHEPEVEDFLAAANDLEAPEAAEALAAVADLLPTAQLAQGAVLAVCCGALVEKHNHAEIAFSAVWAYFQHLQALQAGGQAPPPQVWRFAVMGLMAMLCRSAVNRQQLQAQPHLAAWLTEHDDLSDHFYYLSGMLQVSDEASVYVLFPHYGTGIEVSVSQVNNVFHLLTLLQPLVVQQREALGLRLSYPPTNEQLLRYAQGVSAELPDENIDVARFEWLSAAAYKGGPLDSMQIAWGEAFVRDMPRVQGRVVLLAAELVGPPRRSWDIDFLAVLHDAHRPQVQLRQLLAPDTVAEVLTALHPPVPALAMSVSASSMPASSAGRSWWQRLLGRLAG